MDARTPLVARIAAAATVALGCGAAGAGVTTVLGGSPSSAWGVAALSVIWSVARSLDTLVALREASAERS
jgi:hypothetical protein